MEEVGDGVEQFGAAMRSRQGAEHAGPGLERPRSPRAFLVHCDTFRAITAGRNARSARLFVGSIAGSSRNRTSEPASWHRPSSLSSRWLSRSDSRRSRRCQAISIFSRRARSAKFADRAESKLAPQRQRPFQKRLQLRREPPRRAGLLLDHLRQRPQDVAQALLLLDRREDLGVVDPGPVGDHHPLVVGRDPLADLLVAVSLADLVDRRGVGLEDHQPGRQAARRASRCRRCGRTGRRGRNRTDSDTSPRSAGGLPQGVEGDRPLRERRRRSSSSEHLRQLADRHAQAVMEVVGRRQEPRAEPMGRGPALVGGEVGMPPADDVAPQPLQRWTATRKSRTRGLTTSGRSVIEASSTRSRNQFAAALGAARLGDRDVDRRLGERLRRRGLASLERPLAGLAARLLGPGDPRPLGERRRLPLARTLQTLDLGATRRSPPPASRSGRPSASRSKGGEVRFAHDGQSKSARPQGQVARYTLRGHQ